MTGHFSLLLQRIFTLSAQKESQILVMRSAMDRQNLPSELKKRVIEYQYYSHMNHDSYSYDSLFSSALSTNLKVRLCISVCYMMYMIE
jgi:hypothetical protein